MKEFFSFLRKPEQGPTLRFAHLAPEIWDALGRIPRTGWLKRGIPNPETVQEQTISALKIADVIDGISPEDRETISKMLEVHSWPKARNGDAIAGGANEEERDRNLEERFKKEQEAMINITSYLGNAGEEILALWMRFETENDPTTLLAREIDKYQVIDQAHLYEKKYGIKLFEEFYRELIGDITHPDLRRDLEKLMESRSRYQK